MTWLSALVGRKRKDLQRARRKPVCVKAVVTGQDEYGSTFRDKAEIVNVAYRGGCLVCSHDVKVGNRLKLQLREGTLVVSVCWCDYNIDEDRRYLGFKVVAGLERWHEVISSAAVRKLASGASA